ncbi:unnamed protein product [Anisakis simplex]|uniref:GLOBIN domain-containing protein n=1 Tax=Anisakis simplex TaxID=6269 RepID=A0A0M3JCP2_ANISI|nr:unnamed protein product [Anisakis simplex]
MVAFLVRYKPVSLNAMLKPLKDVYDETFAQCFNVERNANFLSKSEECLSAGRFADFATLMCEIARRALALPAKSVWHPKWAEILVRAERFRQAVLKSALPFAYVRGVVAQVRTMTAH